MTDSQKEKDIREEIEEENTEAAAEEPETKAEESETKADEAETKADEAAEETEEKAEDAEEKTEDKPEAKPEEDEDLKTKHLRLMADFQNYKRRAEEARLTSYSHGREDLVTDLLPIIDNFERALEHDTEDAGFKEGMEMIFKQLMDILEKIGLKEIEALGTEFDPNVHNAVMTEDTDDYESNFVSAVLQKGYKLGDKVIRPSMVKVAN